MIRSVITSKGGTTLPKVIREVLGVSPGNRVQYDEYDNGEVRIVPIRPLPRLCGICQYQETPISLEDMKRTIKDGATGE